MFRGAFRSGGIKFVLCALTVVVAIILTIIGRAENPASQLYRVTGSSDYSKTIYVDFVSVVNLPRGARVLSRGAQIGTVDGISLVPGAARLTLNVDPQSYVPEGTTADLRQMTILGDIYVALTPPANASRSSIGEGDVIGLNDSDPGPQIEDILTNLADFMAGGSIMRVQDALRKVNDSVDLEEVDLPATSATGAKALQDLAAGTQELDKMVDSLEEATTFMASDPSELGYAFGPAGHIGLDAVFSAVNEGFKLVAGSSELALGLSWLAPRLAQLNPFMDQLVPLLRTYSKESTVVNGNLGLMINVGQQKVAPFIDNGAVDIEKVTLNDDDVTRSVAGVLRMIGALR